MSSIFGSKKKQERPEGVPMKFVTTLHEYPGSRTVECFGLIAIVTSTAANTASEKGRESLRSGLTELSVVAAEKGANAILGLQISNFGASQGGMLGDAVGVSLMGTAVRLVHDAPAQS